MNELFFGCVCAFIFLCFQCSSVLLFCVAWITAPGYCQADHTCNSWNTMQTNLVFLYNSTYTILYHIVLMWNSRLKYMLVSRLLHKNKLNNKVRKLVHVWSFKIVIFLQFWHNFSGQFSDKIITKCNFALFLYKNVILSWNSHYPGDVTSLSVGPMTLVCSSRI